jgi:hypothetical protein
MRIFKVYNLDESAHHLILAKSPSQAASIARTVWDEAGAPQPRVKVVEMRLPQGEIGLIYEPNTIPVIYPRRKK